MMPLDKTQSALAAAYLQCLKVRPGLPFDACRQFVVLPENYSANAVPCVTRMMVAREMIIQTGATQAVSASARSTMVYSYSLGSKAESALEELKKILGRKFPKVDPESVKAIRDRKIYRLVKKRKAKGWQPGDPSLFDDA